MVSKCIKLPKYSFNPNGAGGAQCACTFFRQLFFHDSQHPLHDSLLTSPRLITWKSQPKPQSENASSQSEFYENFLSCFSFWMEIFFLFLDQKLFFFFLKPPLSHWENLDSSSINPFWICCICMKINLILKVFDWHKLGNYFIF